LGAELSGEAVWIGPWGVTSKGITGGGIKLIFDRRPLGCLGFIGSLSQPDNPVSKPNPITNVIKNFLFIIYCHFLE